MNVLIIYALIILYLFVLKKWHYRGYVLKNNMRFKKSANFYSNKAVWTRSFWTKFYEFSSEIADGDSYVDAVKIRRQQGSSFSS